MLHFSCLTTVESGEELLLSYSGLISLLGLLARTEAALGSACFGAWPSSVFSSYSVSEREAMGDDFSICKLPSNGKKNEGGKCQAFCFLWSLQTRLFSPVFLQCTLFFKGAIFFFKTARVIQVILSLKSVKNKNLWQYDMNINFLINWMLRQ